jgi:eukaryotic translation initiation factor 2C
MRLENETEAAAKLARTKSKGSLEPRLPQRPGFGTKGKTVVLWTNYFQMTSLVNQTLYRYSIEVSAARGGRSASGKKLKRIIQLLIEQHLLQYSNDIVSDFKANILCTTELALKQAEYEVIYRSEGEDDPAVNAAVYKINLEVTGTITVSELVNYLTSTQGSQIFGSKDETLQALNILVGHYPKTSNQIASVGSNKHYQTAGAATETFSLMGGLMAIRGFFVSVRAATARILVNVQVKHGAFYEAGPLIELIHAFAEQNGVSRIKLEGFLKKLSIDVIHIIKKNKAGNRVARIKTIFSLARRDDGRGQPNPPIVSDFGAGSNDVQFFLINTPPKSFQKPKGKKGKQNAGADGGLPKPSATAGKYISVSNFFKQSKSFLQN